MKFKGKFISLILLNFCTNQFDLYADEICKVKNRKRYLLYFNLKNLKLVKCKSQI